MTNPASAAAPSRSRTVAYWATTVIIAAELALGGVWDTLRIAYVREILEQRLRSRSEDSDAVIERR